MLRFNTLVKLVGVLVLALVFITAPVVLLPACSSSDALKGDSRPAHYTDEGFRNPYIGKKDTGFFDYQKMRYFGEEKWAEYDGQKHLVEKADTNIEQLNSAADLPRFTWVGHATVLIQYQNINILTDPIFG